LYAAHRNESVKTYWQTYTDKQITTCEEVCSAILDFFYTGNLQLPYDTSLQPIELILGNEEISPGRKTDPGPAYPLDKLREKLLTNGRRVNSESDQKHIKDGKVAIDMLNIRAGAGVNFDKVALPLSKEQEVEILEEKDGWFKISTSIQGWVNKAFIKDKKE